MPEPKKKHTLTWDDLTNEAKAQLESTEKAVELIDEGISLLLSGKYLVEERAALYAGRRAAQSISDRHAALLLQSLRAVTENE